MFYWLGLALVLLSWAAGTYLLTKWHDKDFVTISKHAASSRWSYGLFASVLVVVGGLFYAWAAHFLLPKSYSTESLATLLIVSFILQCTTALIPDIPGLWRDIHRYAAWGMAVAWLPLGIIIALASNLSIVGRAICLLLVAYMLFTFCLFLFGYNKRYFLTFQALYVVAFELVFLVAVYIH